MLHPEASSSDSEGQAGEQHPSGPFTSVGTSVGDAAQAAGLAPTVLGGAAGGTMVGALAALATTSALTISLVAMASTGASFGLLLGIYWRLRDQADSYEPIALAAIQSRAAPTGESSGTVVAIGTAAADAALADESARASLASLVDR